MFGVEEVGTLEDHTALRELIVKIKRVAKSTLCVLWNGKHDMYRAFERDRMFQKCNSCGYETPGWIIDRRDR